MLCAGQAVVQFVRDVNDGRQYALKFFLSQPAFEAERRIYSDSPLGKLLPQLDAVRDNRDCALRDAEGCPLPPFVVMERGESLDEWARRRKPDMWEAMPVRICPPLPSWRAAHCIAASCMRVNLVLCMGDTAEHCPVFLGFLGVGLLWTGCELPLCLRASERDNARGALCHTRNYQGPLQVWPASDKLTLSFTECTCAVWRTCMSAQSIATGRGHAEDRGLCTVTRYDRCVATL